MIGAVLCKAHPRSLVWDAASVDETAVDIVHASGLGTVKHISAYLLLLLLLTTAAAVLLND
jgi:hypothetical protein